MSITIFTPIEWISPEEYVPSYENLRDNPSSYRTILVVPKNGNGQVEAVFVDFDRSDDYRTYITGYSWDEIAAWAVIPRVDIESITPLDE